MENSQKIQSNEAYELRLTQWIRKWILLYSRSTVDMTESGDIAHIRGKLIFQREINRICEPVFTEEEKLAYEEQTRILWKEMEELEIQGRRYIREGGMIPAEYVKQAFHLSSLEWFLFAVAYTTELDGQFQRVYCLLQDDFNQLYPTIETALRIYTPDEEYRYRCMNEIMEHWEKLSNLFSGFQASRQRENGKYGRMRTPLKLDARMFAFLLDLDSEDENLGKLIQTVLPGDESESMLIQRAYVEKMHQLLIHAKRESFLHISGAQGSGRKFLVRQYCSRHKRPLLMIDTTHLILEEALLEERVSAIVRESVLKGNAMLCFYEVEASENTELKLRYEKLLWHLRKYGICPVLLGEQKWNQSLETYGMHCMELEIPLTTMEEREILWNTWLPAGQRNQVQLAQCLADRYVLSPGAIRRALEDAGNSMLVQGSDDRADKLLFQACQRQLIHHLGKDAIQISTQYTMEDLVLPAEQKKQLRDACDLVEYHHLVYDKWGFARKIAYGRGTSMIFYGPPGTGKTMGAQAIAGELNMELYKVDMAGILSKYVGESEKKLGNIFEQGAKSQSILFFDEADALFGKRSEVKDSQDKYANASTAYLLQKIEEYEGIIILATNLLQNFDTAFCRRFKFIIEFPFPDEERRREIWSRVFPDNMPREEALDFAYLAEEYKFSGSQIKNVAVAAAFLAAGEGRGVVMKDILQAVKREMRKTGKNMIASDFGKYYELMQMAE